MERARFLENILYVEKWQRDPRQFGKESGIYEEELKNYWELPSLLQFKGSGKLSTFG